jgi:GNAT superfamily N-acetyltransferase
MPGGVCELSKMAVAPELRGLGIGRALLVHAIAKARIIGAQSLILGSNSKLANAVKLYESAGFRHVAPEKMPKLAYSRANVFMELSLR